LPEMRCPCFCAMRYSCSLIGKKSLDGIHLRTGSQVRAGSDQGCRSATLCNPAIPSTRWTFSPLQVEFACSIAALADSTPPVRLAWLEPIIQLTLGDGFPSASGGYRALFARVLLLTGLALARVPFSTIERRLKGPGSISNSTWPLHERTLFCSLADDVA